MTRTTALLTAALLTLGAAPLAAAQTTSPAPAAQTAASQAVAPQSAAQAAASARDLAAQARAAYPKGSASIDQTLWKQAADAAEAAVAAAPGNAEYLKLRADIYTEVGFWKQAETAWNAYFKVQPAAAGSAEAKAAATVQYNLGYAAYTRSQLPQASGFFGACLTLDAQSVPCLTWAARTALESGDYARAQTLYGQARQLAPNDKTLAYFAGLTTTAQAYGPAATQAFSRAFVALDAGKKADALRGFQDAAQSAPNFAEAWRQAGYVALQLGDLSAASAAYAKVTALPGATAADRYNLGLTQEGAQYGLNAVQTFRAAYAKYTAGDKAAAEAGFAQATVQSPTYAKAWAWLGRVRYEAKNYAGATEAYSKAVQLDPNDRASAYQLKLAQQGK